MKLGAVEGSHTQLREQTNGQRTARAPSHPNTQRKRERSWAKRKKRKETGGGGEEAERAGMAMYEPAYLPPNAEEQDFVQAYENVREMYKGGLLCLCYSDDSYCTLNCWWRRCICMCVCEGRVFFLCLLLVFLTLHRCRHVTVCICTLPCLWSLQFLCTCVCVCRSERQPKHAASLNCWVFYWLAHMFAVTPPRCLSDCVSLLDLQACSALICDRTPTNRLWWPLTSTRLREGFSVSLSAPLIVILRPVTTVDINRCCWATVKFINTQGAHASLLQSSSRFIPLSRPCAAQHAFSGLSYILYFFRKSSCGLEENQRKMDELVPTGESKSRSVAEPIAPDL